MGEGAAALDWRALAAPLQTVVVYMGVAQLPRIVERLLAHGAPAARAAAIVEQATLPAERVIAGTLATIVQQAQAAQVGAPALLIVGEVAAQAAAAQAAGAQAAAARACQALPPGQSLPPTDASSPTDTERGA